MPTKKTAPRPAQRAERPAIAVVERPVVKPTTQRHGFKTNEYIVYPAHGVGQILAIEEQEVAGYKLELFVISFIKDKMTLRVPVTKIATVGMRKLSEGALVKRALETLKGRARIKRTMWSRRAQEYEAKINSGDIVAIAEVVRDLFRSDKRPSTGSRARSRRCSAAQRPRRSRRSRARSPRARAAVRSLLKVRPMPKRPRSRTRRRKLLAFSRIDTKARSRDRAFSFAAELMLRRPRWRSSCSR